MAKNTLRFLQVSLVSLLRSYMTRSQIRIGCIRLEQTSRGSHICTKISEALFCAMLRA